MKLYSIESTRVHIRHSNKLEERVSQSATSGLAWARSAVRSNCRASADRVQSRRLPHAASIRCTVPVPIPISRAILIMSVPWLWQRARASRFRATPSVSPASFLAPRLAQVQLSLGLESSLAQTRQHAAHLEQRLTRWRSGIDSLLMRIQIHDKCACRESHRERPTRCWRLRPSRSTLQ